MNSPKPTLNHYISRLLIEIFYVVQNMCRSSEFEGKTFQRQPIQAFWRYVTLSLFYMSELYYNAILWKILRTDPPFLFDKGTRQNLL